MKKVMVFTDSTSDVEQKFFEEYDFDYLMNSFHFEHEDDKEFDSKLDWSMMSAKDFYDAMRGGKLAKTSMIQRKEAETKFEAALKAGFDILYVACSSKLSGSVNLGKQVADELLPAYPGRKVVCFDTLRSCYAEGQMAMDAAKMAKDGAELEEIVKYLDTNKFKYQTYATVGTLTYLARAGRVKAGKAFFGNLFGVKPILVGATSGNNFAFEKMKGRKNALDELIRITVENLDNPAEKTVYVEHADSEADAKYVADAIKAKTGCKNVNISMIGPIIGASVGPDTVMVDYLGKEVTIVGEE